MASLDVNKSSMLKNLITIQVYEVKFSTAELIKFDEFFAIKSVKFDESFTFKSHEIKSFAADKSINELINELIFKHMTSSVRNKYKNEDKISSSFL